MRRRLIASAASAALVLTSLVAIAAPAAAAPTAQAEPILQEVTLAKGPAAMGEPMALTVLPDRTVLHTSRDGRIFATDTLGNTILAATLPVYNHDEDGLQGIAADPDFATNRWIYVYYAPVLAATPAGDAPANGTDADFARWQGHNQLSRFTVRTDGTVDLASEKKLLQVTVDRGMCCHVGGDLDFDAQGNLYLTTGDDTQPWSSAGYTPIDERDGFNWAFDAQRSSGNTNDLRGKLLRIHPEDDGSYTVPAGNLFAPGTEKTRPEIYAMGFRNPFRMSVDKATGVVYVGTYAADAEVADPNRGDGGHQEFERITGPGNFGWPYCQGYNSPYNDFDFATFTSGPKFDCAAPVNHSPHNTGLTELPPAQPAWIAYDGGLDSPLGNGGGPMAGPVYHFDPALDSPTKLPASFDNKFFAGEFTQDWIKTITADGDGSAGTISDFPWTHKHIMDLAMGPEGALYVLDYGAGWFNGDENSALYRIETAPNGNRAPTAVATADRTSGPGPLTVTFGSAGSSDPEGDALSYSWSFGDGATSTSANPSHTYAANGTYPAKLTVQDPAGNFGSATVTITVGNTVPTVTISGPPAGSGFAFGDPVPYQVTVTDPEDGTIDCTKVVVNFVLGHDEHGHPMTSATGCTGVLQTTANSEHGPSDNLFGVIDAAYTDGSGLVGHAQVVLQPRHRQAEHFANSSGNLAVYQSPASEGGYVGAIDNGEWISFDPYHLVGVTGFSARVSSANAGGTLAFRTGSATGPVVGSITVPGTGGWDNFVTVNGTISGASGSGPLFLTFAGAPDQALFNVDSFTFTGGGTASSDLARYRPVTVSSTYEDYRVGSLAVDGDATTRWSSEYADPQWIRVDLGAAHELARVRLSWETAYATGYEIQTSLDGDNWTTVHSTTNGNGGVDDIEISGTGRYVRMYGTARATGWGYSLFDFNVYGPSEEENPPETYQVMVFSKTAGYRHESVEAGISAIEQLGRENGFRVDSTEDATSFTSANLAQYEAVVFLSTTGDALNNEQQAAFEAYIRGGGGFAGVHAAADTEYDWPWYGGLVGAWFDSHPATQPATVRFEDRANPSTAHFAPSWTHTDEWYNYRTNPRANVKVLATVDESTYSGGGMGADHPITWCQEYDGGRAWYTGMGHTTQSFGEENYLRMLLGGIRLAADQADADCRPETGYTALFDGTQPTFEQWRQAGPGGFTLDNGTLTSFGGMGLLWYPARTYSNYSLKVDWMMPGDDNGGVFIGFPDPQGDPWKPVSDGHEIQIDATDADPTRTTGSVYSLKAPDTALREANLNPPGEWNTYDIRVHGQQVEVYLNGVKLTDYTSSRNIAEGFFGVQNDGAGMDISYRNIRIRTDGIPTGEDLARDRLVTASSVEPDSSHLPGNAVDGDPATRWASEHLVDPQWITVDLGAEYELERVRLAWEAAYASAYEVQTSTDGSTWNRIYGSTTADGGVDDLTVAGAGRHVRVYATARATNWGYSLYDINVYGTPVEEPEPDTTAPVTRADVAGPATGGWFTSAATVTLTSTDETGGSGVGSTEYQVDADPTWTVYTGPVQVTGDGEHVFRYRSTDRAGNVSAPGEVPVRIDGTAPVSTAAFAPANDNGWHAGAVPVTLAATDAGSGVGPLEWSLDGGPWTAYATPVDVTGDGQHELLYRAKDAAGNLETLKSALVRIDGTKPTVIVSGLADGQLYGDSQDVRVTFQAVDPTSGLAATVGTLDGAPYASNTLQALYELSLGLHELTVTATDKAGNTSTSSVRFFVTTSFRDMGNLLDRFRATERLSAKAHRQLVNKLAAVRDSEAAGNDKRAVQQLAAFTELASDAVLVPDADVRGVLVRDADAMIVLLGGAASTAGVAANEGRQLKGAGRPDGDTTRVPRGGRL
ncbi:PKD domain-containing protein [Micromonospora pisi]|uniref:PKD domain-containing protein n=1 Tax=Micromonospora pisi TaxID=589240 RepID=A0A495JT54_9ACTN|nr:ThuA domain-containing protein [Micromonospora pisi]RKR92021.1 PKD domain-containing protein [Micromonospora pisi]